MYKEIVITVLVVALIVVGNIVTQNNTNMAVDKMNEKLSSLRNEIIKENVNSEQSKNMLEETQNTWNEQYETMAYYIEHNELEKVETELTKLKANIETKEYQTAVESLDNCDFILKHIKDKNALKIINIF